MTRSPSQIFAAHLLAGFVAAGVEHAFVSPGSRSQALAIAAWQLAEAGALDLRVRLDERSAAFQALGVGKLTGFPALLICTSGTAFERCRHRDGESETGCMESPRQVRRRRSGRFRLSEYISI